MKNKYPYDIETPLDRRAMSIDILTGEIVRKNKTISYWKKKAEEFRDRCDGFKTHVEELHERINELENDCITLEEKISELETKQNFYPSPRVKRTMKKKQSSNNKKANGTLEDKY